MKDGKNEKNRSVIRLLADNCEQARNTYDDVYCTNKLYASAEAELNKNYQLLRGKLSENQKKILKKSQLAWIHERDAQCTTDTGIDVSCRLSTTQERNNWLRERLRECVAIGCKTNMLN
ncbi:lysozyme inhibitor LprI family protein [Acinetobacter sp. ANC 3813]|uniref:lysozyme inhibitor LprI family protein n=1 Tax=Acinetobacter sp. ANC 3813 TaxID=1977873 RepID=UPI000A334DF0|nr:lysozyme inhibitor LprI family protein [Acinetobacter sp. ANC 3813]OTG90070.1 hypothetical protein B9T34_09600 [Acinetobacter sp. ANC 3813]